MIVSTAASLWSAANPTAAMAATTTTTDAALQQATITQKVFMDVRISRPDGTFYVRDDDDNDADGRPENQVFRGRLTIGLFGMATPNHVRRFLEYVTANSSPVDDDSSSSTPLPSYSRSIFNRFDEGTGILYGGAIPSLEVTTLPQGSTAVQYGGRLLPAQLWINNNTRNKKDGATTTEQRLSHLGKGLLTHRNLDVTPVFGVTTRQDTTALDRTHTVFGRLVLDDTAVEFLDRVAHLPVYSVDAVRPVTTNKITNEQQPQQQLMDDAAAAVFRAQRDLFRTTAQRLGDTRIQKLVTGKLLRRVEVTQVGVLL